MVKRPDGMNAFEFSVLSGLRSAKVAVTAQHEVAQRKVVRSANIDVAVPDPAEQG